MTTPEQEQKQLPPEVQEASDRFNPEVEKRLQEFGAQVRPTSPKPVKDDQGRVIAGDTGKNAGVTIQVQADQSQATNWSHGSPSDSKTWLGVTILRKIKRALHYGWKIVIGKGP
jgi:hypothetical protein